MTKLLIADDQALVRVGLRKILESEPQTTVVGEAGDGQDAVRVWTAPKAGKIHITGSVCNTGNRSSASVTVAGPKPGTADFAPWYALYDHQTDQGVFIGWDYFGHWASAVNASERRYMARTRSAWPAVIGATSSGMRSSW